MYIFTWLEETFGKLGSSILSLGFSIFSYIVFVYVAFNWAEANIFAKLFVFANILLFWILVFRRKLLRRFSLDKASRIEKVQNSDGVSYLRDKNYQRNLAIQIALDWHGKKGVLGNEPDKHEDVRRVTATNQGIYFYDKKGILLDQLLFNQIKEIKKNQRARYRLVFFDKDLTWHFPRWLKYEYEEEITGKIIEDLDLEKIEVKRLQDIGRGEIAYREFFYRRRVNP